MRPAWPRECVKMGMRVKGDRRSERGSGWGKSQRRMVGQARRGKTRNGDLQVVSVRIRRWSVDGVVAKPGSTSAALELSDRSSHLTCIPGLRYLRHRALE